MTDPGREHGPQPREIMNGPLHPTWLKDYSRDVYSQTGEDGIIEKILELLPSTDRWCVEFGAWDGAALSNTRNLIKEKGYSAVLIEGDPLRFEQLKRTCASDPNTTALNRYVGFSEDDNLDHILETTPIPRNFDFASIDIDGNDWHVWKAMTAYRPKVLCIEFNPTIPANVRFVQRADSSVNQGSSLSSLVDLGKEKGYELVSVSKFNAIFVERDYFHLFRIEDNAPEVLWLDQDMVTYMFSGYDGKIFLQGFSKLPWHKISLKQGKFQILPGFLQDYPGNYSYLQRLTFGVHLLFHEPRLLAREVRERGGLLGRRLRRRLTRLMGSGLSRNQGQRRQD